MTASAILTPRVVEDLNGGKVFLLMFLQQRRPTGLYYTARCTNVSLSLQKKVSYGEILRNCGPVRVLAVAAMCSARQ